MRSLCCHEFGPPETLQFLDAPDLVAECSDLIIEVRAAGVGFVDGLMIQGKYQVKPPLPYYPGSEISGVVVDVGPQVSQWQVGDAVMGLAARGGFATHARLNASAAMPKPDSLTFAQSAGWLVNYATALYGWKHCGRAASGEFALVLGAAGGVGSAAIAVANALGLEVIAAASTDAKRSAAIEFGAIAAVDYSQAGWRDVLNEVLGSRQLTLVYDPVGGAASELAFRSLKPGGRHLVVGFASGDIPSIPLNLALLKQSSIVGVDWGGAMRADPELTPRLFETLAALLNDGSLEPPPVVTRSFDEAKEAIAEQLKGAILGKLVLEM